MSDEKNFMDKRRFQRVNFNTEITVYNANRMPMGKGEVVDVSASGIKFETLIEKGITKGGELLVSFALLPDGPAAVKVRGEVKMLTKLPMGWTVSLRFTELKTIDLLKDYIEKKVTKKNENESGGV